jgi:hypothetical protein
MGGCLLPHLDQVNGMSHCHTADACWNDRKTGVGETSKNLNPSECIEKFEVDKIKLMMGASVVSAMVPNSTYYSPPTAPGANSMREAMKGTVGVRKRGN